MEEKSSSAEANPSNPIPMSPSKSDQKETDPELKTSESQTPNRESSDPPTENKDPENLAEGESAEAEEEEEGECGFCLFMKGGGCRDTFTDWEKCVEEGEKNNEDIVEKCFQVTSALKKCMEEHSDYYAPILQAEKAVEAEAVKELEKEKANEGNAESGSSVAVSSEAVGDSRSSEQKEEA